MLLLIVAVVWCQHRSLYHQSGVDDSLLIVFVVEHVVFAFYVEHASVVEVDDVVGYGKNAEARDL